MAEKLKSENVALVSAAGAGTGILAREMGLSTGNQVVDAFAGAAIAVAGYMTSYDGISDFAEGFGIGYFFDSVL